MPADRRFRGIQPRDGLPRTPPAGSFLDSGTQLPDPGDGPWWFSMLDSDPQAVGARRRLREARWLGTSPPRSRAQRNVTATASVKFAVGLGFTSVNHAWKCQVSPGCTATGPPPSGRTPGSTARAKRPAPPVCRTSLV